jgi:hypothetical protein
LEAPSGTLNDDWTAGLYRIHGINLINTSSDDASLKILVPTLKSRYKHSLVLQNDKEKTIKHIFRSSNAAILLKADVATVAS